MNAKLSSSKKARRAPSKAAAAEKVVVPEPEPSELEELDDELESDRKGGRPRVVPSAGDVFGAAELARQVAESLRRHRKTQQLSLDDLAQRSGVSRALCRKPPVAPSSASRRRCA